MAVVCEHAGCKRAASAERALIIVSLTDVEGTRSLLRGDFDALPCESCAEDAGIRPSLLVFSIAFGELVHLDRGFGPEALGEFAKQNAERLGALRLDTLAVQDVGDLEGFKSAVANLLKRLMHRCARFQWDTPPQFYLDNWLDLQGECQTALLLGALGLVPNARVALRSEAGDQQNFDDMAEVLGQRCIKLITFVAIGLPTLISQGITLEELLIRVVDTSHVLQQNAEGIVSAVASVQQYIGEQGIHTFHLRALMATICATLEKENPDEVEWATSLLSFEITRRNGVEPDDNLERSRISKRRARATVSFEKAWDATASWMQETLPGKRKSEISLPDVCEASECFGYPDLAAQILHSGLQVTYEDNKPRDPLAPLKLLSRTEPSAGVLRMFAGPSWSNDPAEVEALARALLEKWQANLETKAEILVWFGERIKIMGEPGRALSLIDSKASDWEYRIPAGLRCSLWTERSNAFRLAGDLENALAVAVATLDLVKETPNISAGDQAVAWQNVGILQRDTGRMEQALRSLSAGLEKVPAGNRGKFLESLGVALGKCGQYANAADVYAEAQRTMGGYFSNADRLCAKAMECVMRLNAGQNDRATHLLLGLGPLTELPLRALPILAAVLCSKVLLEHIQGAAKDLASDFVARMDAESASAVQAGNYLLAAHFARSAAFVASYYGFAESLSLWKRDAEFSLKGGGQLHIVTAIELARAHAISHSPELAEAIMDIAAAIDHEVGSIELAPETFAALSSLDSHFDRLAEVLVDQYPLKLVQAITELRRNAHSRAVMLRRADAHVVEQTYALVYDGPAQCALRAPKEDVIAVLEWAGCESGYICLLTVIRDNTADTDWLGLPEDLDLLAFADRVGRRLETWRVSRPGEPFDDVDWEGFTTWITQSIESRMGSEGHIIIIDDRFLSQIPFHIALQPKWTVSYEPNWSSVYRAIDGNGLGATEGSFGVASVPRANETCEVVAAFAASASRSTFGPNWNVRRVADNAADAEALTQLMASSSVVKLLCHGQVSREDADVGLRVASGGFLPPGNSFAESGDDKRPHRFGWREFSRLQSVPKTVFLGACSAGKVSVSGMDERISLASSLRKVGSKCVVAPRWRIDVALTFPILDDAIERFVRHGVPVARALISAGLAAVERGIPRWQAFAFIIEGSWK